MSVIKEFQRLRTDLEARSSEYHDLTLFVYYSVKDTSAENIKFRKPNHAITLWKFMGSSIDGKLPHGIETMNFTRFGLSDAEVGCFGVVEGEKTDLFVKMAHRAGSLIPSEVIHTITANVMNNVVDKRIEGKPLFECNSNPLAVWLNLMLTLIQTYQPNRFKDQRLTVDLFTASLSAVDHIIEIISQVPLTTKMNNENLVDKAKRFRVALSFPGEKREFVEKVADHLVERIGRSKVFYDNFYKAELAKPNLDTVLQSIYHKDADLVAVFLCKEYEKKEWCGLEWRAVRDMIKQRRDNEIMFFKFDDADITGLFSIDGYIDATRHTPLEVAEFICQRLNAH